MLLLVVLQHLLYWICQIDVFISPSVSFRVASDFFVCYHMTSGEAYVYISVRNLSKYVPPRA